MRARISPMWGASRGRLGDDGEIGVGDSQALRGQPGDDVAQQRAAVGAGPARIGVREHAADVAEAGRAEQGVAQRVQRDVAVRVRDHAVVVRDAHAADDHPLTGPEGVHVESMPNAHHRSSRRRNTASASARSSGPVTFRLAVRPATSAGR
jgi:hypothetical protein